MQVARLRKRKASALAAAVLASVSGAALAPGVFAKIVQNTIDPVLTLSADGRHISVTGPISCSETQSLDLRVIVTQRTTGAIAQGHARTTCTTEEQHWEVQAWARGDQVFEAGAARMVAVALTSSRQGIDDAHQWLVDVTLSEE